MRAALGVAAALLLASPSLRAQAAVRVVDASTRRPIAGAEVQPIGADSVLVRAIGYRAVRAARGARVELTPLPLALDRVVVTAARREQTLADVVVTTEVVSADDIARTGASDLGSALLAATGIELAPGTPSGAGVMLQGMSSSRVLILLDGQPLPGRIGGDFDLSRLPTAMVDRVEIVKGPQSALYGTDAMGGVVNIITRAPAADGRSMSASAIYGSRNRMDASLGAAAQLGDAALRVDAGRRSVETTPGRAEARGALSQRLDGAVSLRWTPTAVTTVDASVLALDERQRWPGGSLYFFGDNVQVSARARVAREQVGGGRLSLSGFGSVYDHLSRASSQPRPIRGDTGQRQVQRLFQGELAFSRESGRHLLDAAMLVRHDDTRSARNEGGRRGLMTLEPSLQVESDFGGVTLVTGGRVSRSERWGTHATPRLAVRWRPAKALTLRASAGTGFRAPDFRELYMKFQNDAAGYAIYGNEDLRPERSRNVSAGLEWATDAGFARAQLYHNVFDGFIEATLISAPGDPLIFEYRNVDHGTTRGVELEGASAAGRLRMEGGYALLDARDERTGLPLLGRPRHSARATLSRPLFLGARGSVSAIYTGRTPMRRDDEGTAWRDAYPRFDARLARPVGGSAELTLNVENVLDRRPALWGGYAGRQISIGISLSSESRE